MARWITNFGLWFAAILFLLGTIYSYFATTNIEDFLFFTFLFALGASSQVALNCIIVFLYELRHPKR